MELATAPSTEITTIMAEVAALRASHAAQEAKIAALEAGAGTEPPAPPRPSPACRPCRRTRDAPARQQCLGKHPRHQRHLQRLLPHRRELYILNTATQTTCPTGMTKTTWQQSGLLDYGYVYNHSAQTVSNPGNVTFDSNGPLAGISHTPGSASITMNTPGVYQVTYSITPQVPPALSSSLKSTTWRSPTATTAIPVLMGRCVGRLSCNWPPALS